MHLFYVSVYVAFIYLNANFLVFINNEKADENFTWIYKMRCNSNI